MKLSYQTPSEIVLSKAIITLRMARARINRDGFIPGPFTGNDGDGGYSLMDAVLSDYGLWNQDLERMNGKYHIGSTIALVGIKMFPQVLACDGPSGELFAPILIDNPDGTQTDCFFMKTDAYSLMQPEYEPYCMLSIRLAIKFLHTCLEILVASREHSEAIKSAWARIQKITKNKQEQDRLLDTMDGGKYRENCIYIDPRYGKIMNGFVATLEAEYEGLKRFGWAKRYNQKGQIKGI